MLYPLPAVLVTSRSASGEDDVCTVAWAGTVCTSPAMVSISLKPSRLSYQYIRETGVFGINLTTEELAYATDYCGVRSGRDTDKSRETGLRYVPAENLEIAPAVDGAPVSLSCRVRQVIPLGSHDMFLGEVVAVRVRKDLVDEKGSLHLEKAHLIVYSHGLYQKLGDVMGFFGWSVAREEVRKKRMAQYR